MTKHCKVFPALFLACFLSFVVHAQDISTAKPSGEIRVIVAPANQSSDTVIAIPPDTSWSTTVISQSQKAAKSKTSNLADWLRAESARNGLHSIDMNPWHIVIVYDQLDDKGDKVHSGVIEEFWAAPKEYKISYKGDNLNQTDYATDHGLFRLGDQQWPSKFETLARTQIVDPFSEAATLHGFRAGSVERRFGGHTLNCFVFENTGPGPTSIPDQYCFDPQGSALRYVRGDGWLQTTYNDIAMIDGRNIARDVEVTDSGHLFLKLRVKTYESLPNIDEKDFIPPADAVSLLDKPLTGVHPTLIHSSNPDWPGSLRRQNFSVGVKILIGKNGHVVSAHALSGPASAYKDAETAARKWIYQPYLVAGEAAEVETTVHLNYYLRKN